MRHPLSLIGGLLLAVILTGCSSGPEPITLPPVTSTPSSLTPSTVPAATPTPDVAEAVTPPPSQMNADGASAFARYYYDVYNAATESGDVSQLERISDPSCMTCLGQRQTLEGDALAGNRVVGARTVVREAVSPGGENPMPYVSLQLETKPGQVIRADGTSEELTERSAFVSMQLTWKDGTWRVFRIFFD